MKNIRKEILFTLLISSLLSGCLKKESNYYLKNILNNNKDTTYVDEYLSEDKQTINNISKLEKEIDMYYAKNTIYSKKQDIKKNISDLEINSLYDLLNYTLISEVCDNLNLSFEDDHSFNAKYVKVLKDDDSISMYILYFDNNVLYVINNNDNKLFDLIRYIAILSEVNIKGYDNTVDILKDSLDVCKEVISRDTYINEENEFYTKNKVKGLIK